MTDPEKLVVAGLVLLFLGGSLLAAIAVLDRRYLPVAAVAYLLVAVGLLQRLRRADNPLG